VFRNEIATSIQGLHAQDNKINEALQSLSVQVKQMQGLSASMLKVLEKLADKKIVEKSVPPSRSK
jgi:hypothetical protein